jgi:hypothetical protein
MYVYHLEHSDTLTANQMSASVIALYLAQHLACAWAWPSVCAVLNWPIVCTFLQFIH